MGTRSGITKGQRGEASLESMSDAYDFTKYIRFLLLKTNGEKCSEEKKFS